MSRILKADGGLTINSFDFGEIEAPSGAVAQEDSPPEAPEPVEPPAVDPLEELEETIKNRLLDAERRAQELEKEAYEKGYAQGQKDGYEYGMKSIEIVREHLEKLLHSMEAVPERVFSDYREWFITSCLAVARRIVRRELETDPGVMARMIETLLDEASEEHTLTFYVHPKDLELLQKFIDTGELSQKPQQSFSLKADAHIERGGCRAESQISLVDASIEARFKLIEEAMRTDGSVADESAPSE